MWRRQIYASQTTILEGVEICAFEVLFYGLSTLFGLRTIEKSIKNPHFIFCSSFQNLRLGGIIARDFKTPTYGVQVGMRDHSNLWNFMFPKRRFWKVEPTFQNAFSKHFSTFARPNPVLSPLKSASKTHSEMLVRPSKIFVWEG